MWNNAIERFRRRRNIRLVLRLDARFDDDEDEESGGNKGGGHGNTRIPYGLCQREGIEIQAGWSPSDAWEALKGKGYSAKEVYSELKKTGKVPSGGSQAPSKPKKLSDAEFGEAKKKYQDACAEEKKKFTEEIERKMAEAYENEEKKRNEWRGARRERDLAVQERQEKEAQMYRTGDQSPQSRAELDALAEKEAQAQSKVDKTYEEMKQFGNEYSELERRKSDKGFEAHMYDTPAGREYRNAVLSRYPSYDDCDDVSHVEERMNATGSIEPGGKVSLKGLPVEQAREIGRSADDFCDRCPAMKGHIRAIQIGNLGSTTYAQEQAGAVAINSRFYTDTNRFERQYESDLRSGFHPEGTTTKSVLYHELTHCLETYANKQSRVMGGSYGLKVTNRNEDLSSTILHAVSKKFKKTIGKVKKDVSVYAGKMYADNYRPRHAEFLAEAYSEYLTSPNPRPVAMEVGRMMDEELRRRGLMT